MTKISPFKAVHYNPEKIKELSKVVCPPYDIISPKKQQFYHDLDAHNLIRVIFGLDVPQEDKYQRAGQIYREWLKNQVLVQDEKPAIYFYTQQYKIKGETRIRYGFICRLHLKEKNSSIYAHEHTRQEAKDDRSKIIRSVRANLSPIFVVFSDKKKIIQSICLEYIKARKPFQEATDDEGVNHKLWRIDEPSVVERMQEHMKDENIFIADGHHRYEVACAYRDEMKKKLGPGTGEEDYNYVMSYFTNTDTRGLSIMPIHRLLKLAAPLDTDKFFLQLSAYFDVERVKDRVRFFFLLQKAGSTEHVIGMYQAGKYWLIRLKNVKILDKLITDRPKEYRNLDVSILNYIILHNVLGLPLEDKENLTFIPQEDELISRVDNDPTTVGFLLNPVKMQQIMDVALTGNRMPPKSTYFYPKVLSGLVINPLNDAK